MICDEDLLKIGASLAMYEYTTKAGSHNSLTINEGGNPLYGISLDLNDLPAIATGKIFGISYRYFVGLEALLVVCMSNIWISGAHPLSSLDLSLFLGISFLLIAVTRMHNSLLVMRMVAVREVNLILADRKEN